jgi:hypothetical protein
LFLENEVMKELNNVKKELICLDGMEYPASKWQAEVCKDSNDLGRSLRRADIQKKVRLCQKLIVILCIKPTNFILLKKINPNLMFNTFF